VPIFSIFYTSTGIFENLCNILKLKSDAGVEEVAYKLIPGGPKNDSTFSNEVYKKEVLNTLRVTNYFTH